jgi:hypothetical protein
LGRGVSDEVATGGPVEEVLAVPDITPDDLDAQSLEFTGVEHTNGVRTEAGALQFVFGHVVVGDDFPSIEPECFADMGTQEATAASDQYLQ